jgi:murein DD-endopeptidase MepM/ murein hydrolase activator NlpD
MTGSAFRDSAGAAILKRMRFSNIHRLLTFVALSFASLVAIPSSAQSPSATLIPALVEAGAPELIRVTAPAGSTIEGQWQGHPLQFFPAKNAAAGSEPVRTATTWYALAGVDVETAPGPSTMKITVHADNTSREITSTIAIHPAHYRTSSITVEPKFVEPGPEDEKLIEAAAKAKEKAFAASANHPLWSGSFVAPVKAQPTDSFGTRRMFNGKLASIHKGTDFRAHSGTPVLAGNSGTVILAQPLYFEGNCVMIDHGLGLTSISMHLSRIDVKTGQDVKKGQQLGLSGATGRVTGPHLHWAIRWQGGYLDPAKLLKLNLNNIR